MEIKFDHPLPKDKVLLSQVSNASGCRSPRKNGIGRTRSFGEIDIAAKVKEVVADEDQEEVDSQSHAVSVPLVRATEYVNATDKRTLAGDLASSVPIDGNHPVLHSVRSGKIDSNGPASPRSPRSDQPGAYELGDLLSEPEDIDLNEIRGLPASGSKFKKKFWIWFAVAVVQAIATIVGVCILIWGPKALTTDFQVWRLCFFIALAPVTWMLANFLTYLLIKLVEKTMMTVLNALYFAYAVRKHIRWVVRALLILILWALMMMVETSAQNKDINDAYKIVLEILACVLIFTIGNLLKRLGAKYMALKFHETAHHEKMKTALKKEHYLKSLLRPRMRAAKELGRNGMPSNASLPSLFSGMRQRSSTVNHASKQWSETSSKVSSKSQNKDMSFFSEMHNTINHDNEGGDGKETLSAGYPINIKIESLNQRNERSVKGLRELDEDKSDDEQESHEGSEQVIQSVKDENKLKPFPQLDIPEDCINNPKVRARVLHHLTKLEHYIRKTSLEVTFRDELNRVEKSNVSTDLDAKRVAYYLFWNLKPDVGASCITEKDLKPFLWENEVSDAFKMLDVDGDKKIKLKDCIESVKLIHKERKNLALTLRDAKAINNSLEFLLGLVIHVLLIFIYLWILGADNVSQAWLSFSGIILAFSFIFATAVQQAFENIIFLYSVRSYTTGDTLLYNDRFLTVQEISINYTCFMSDLNQQFWIATTELRRTPFVNLSNSGNKWEIINILVDADSDPEVLRLIQDIVASLHKNNPKEYGTGQRAKYSKAVDPFKFNIQVLFEYSHNGLDLGRTAAARSYVMERISEVLRTKSVSYTLPSIRPDALAQHLEEHTGNDMEVQATQNRDVFTRLANVAPF